MGNSESTEKEKTKQAEEETKQKQIQLQTEQLKLQIVQVEQMGSVVKKQQELEENIALNKKFSIIHGGVTVQKDGTPHLDTTLIVADDADGLQVCNNLF